LRSITTEDDEPNRLSVDPKLASKIGQWQTGSPPFIVTRANALVALGDVRVAVFAQLGGHGCFLRISLQFSRICGFEPPLYVIAIGTRFVGEDGRGRSARIEIVAARG
jgi:hypothetical protein